MLGIATSSVNRILSDNWTLLTAHVEPALLPVAERGRRKVSIQAFGCGVYGCVAPTSTDGVVFKLTTDPSEIEFIQAAIKIGEWPDGIVRYHRVLKLQGVYHGREAYAIWREAAYNVGEGWFAKAIKDDYARYERNRFMKRLEEFKGCASYIREAIARGRKAVDEVARLNDWAWNNISEEDLEWKPFPSGRGYDVWQMSFVARHKGAYRYAAAWRLVHIIAEMMGSEPGGYKVGEALQFYLERGMLLCDVHANNIGEVRREDYREPVLAITDPGHLVVVPSSWLQ